MTIAAFVPTWLCERGATFLAAHEQRDHQTLRLEKWQTFLAHGLPQRRDERWKYVDFSFVERAYVFPEPAVVSASQAVVESYRLQKEQSYLLVFIDGHFIESLSDKNKLPDSVFFSRLADIDTATLDVAEKESVPNAFTQLNDAVFTDGVLIRVADQAEILPIHFLFISSGQQKNCMFHPQHHLIVGEKSKVTLIEEYRFLSSAEVDETYFMNASMRIQMHEGAHLSYYKIQNESKYATHIENIYIQQKENSAVDFHSFSFGARLARDTISIFLQGEGARCKTAGLYQLSDAQQAHYDVGIHHEAPRGQSEMLYKGILDKTSRAVFQGKLTVQNAGTQTIAQQANHHLLLSREAEAISSPQLEIYADNIQCKHGATVGQLDEAALFYLCSRGVSKHDALLLLRNGFAEEMMERVTHSGVLIKLREMMHEYYSS
jgi:Fe-S cluster assembly protein SufD